MKLTKKTTIQAKVETTYGTAATLAATDALLVRDASITPIAADVLDRDLITGALGNQPQIRVKESVQIAFTVEIAGSGKAGDAPAWGKLLQGCGFSGSVTANTSTTYAPIDSNFKSLTIKYVVDGTAHIAVGCRGTVQFSLSANAIPTMAFTFTGLVGSIAEVSNPASNTNAWQKPIPPTTANTPVLTLDGAELCVSELGVDFGAQVEHLSLVGKEEIIISDRGVTGNVTFAAPKLSDKDYFALVRSEDLKAFALTHGTVAGNIVQIAGAKVQLADLNYGDVQGVATLSSVLRFVPNAGQDEISITVK